MNFKMMIFTLFLITTGIFIDLPTYAYSVEYHWECDSGCFRKVKCQERNAGGYPYEICQYLEDRTVSDPSSEDGCYKQCTAALGSYGGFIFRYELWNK